MVVIYYRKKSKEYYEYIEWLNKKKIEVKSRELETITEKEIFQVIYHLDIDIIDIVRQDIHSPLLIWKLHKLKKMRFSECLTYLKINFALLKMPIVFFDDFSFIGYEKEKIENYFF